MKFLFLVLFLLHALPSQVFGNTSTAIDSSRNSISITIQPILNISGDELLLQYLSFNIELSRLHSNSSFDLQSVTTYTKLRYFDDFYRSIEYFTFVESEFGYRWYMKNKLHGKKKKLKNPDNEMPKISKNNFPSGLYLRPAVGFGLGYDMLEEKDVFNNVHRITKKVSFLPTTGFYIGHKYIPESSRMVVNIFCGLKIGLDFTQKIIFISPMISVGAGISF